VIEDLSRRSQCRPDRRGRRRDLVQHLNFLTTSRLGDLAVGLDYSLVASGIGSQVDFFLDGLLSELGVPGFL
jgi:hypothetical protein